MYGVFSKTLSAHGTGHVSLFGPALPGLFDFFGGKGKNGPPVFILQGGNRRSRRAAQPAVVVDADLAGSWLAQAQAIVGWDAGSEYSPHPVHLTPLEEDDADLL